MKCTSILRAATILVLTSNLVRGEETPEMKLLREQWRQAVEKAVAPINSRYHKELNALKLRYTREGKLAEAVAVEAEIKELERGPAIAGAPEPSRKLEIVSAKYGNEASNRFVDTTDVIRRALEAGQDGIKLNTRYGSDGKDPAAAAAKVTIITYSIRGEVKTVTFPENFDLIFKDHLK
jgi:hypothetical protein